MLTDPQFQEHVKQATTLAFKVYDIEGQKKGLFPDTIPHDHMEGTMRSAGDRIRKHLTNATTRDLIDGGYKALRSEQPDHDWPNLSEEGFRTDLFMDAQAADAVALDRAVGLYR